jgi:hypothetical protein
VPDWLAPRFLADGKTCVRDCLLEEGLVREANRDVGLAISVSARVGYLVSNADFNGLR